MGILKWLFGKGGKARDYAKIEKIFGKWAPYKEDACLPGTRIPRKMLLPPEVEKWGDIPGEASISTALFPYWLRVDPRRAGFMINQISQGKMYRKIEIPREGKTPRIISAPAPGLKSVQKIILERILEQVPVNSSSSAFEKGKSIFTAAAPHAAKRVVVTFDIRDFFPSIKFARVVGMFVQIGFDRKRAMLLAGLCCSDGALPQGAPTSPAISNLVCRRLDSRLAGLAKKYGFSYTRYADDIILSGTDRLVRFIPFVRQIIEKEGFKLAEEKTGIRRSGSRQRILGLNVNTSVSVPKKVRRLVRAMIHKQKKERNPELVPFLYGHIAFMKPAHRAQAEKLRKDLDASAAQAS